MPRHIRLDISPATATHCGDGFGRCHFLDGTWPRCDAFPRSKTEPEYDSDKTEFLRSPECLAAEKGASE